MSSGTNNFHEEPCKYYTCICRPASKERGKKADQERAMEGADGFIHIPTTNGLVKQVWEIRDGADIHTYIELTDPLGWKDVKSTVIPDSKRMFLRAFRLNHLPRDQDLYNAFMATMASHSMCIKDGTLMANYGVSQWLDRAQMAPSKRLAASVQAVAAKKLGAGKKIVKKPVVKHVSHEGAMSEEACCDETDSGADEE